MPAPNPTHWRLLDKHICAHAYALKVLYPDCTNYEGVKVLVFRGWFNPNRIHLDPHFSPALDAPIARFAPTTEGWLLAITLAEHLST